MSLPLFNWLQQRAAGVLLHPTSLPGDFGIGTLDKEAVRFLKFLSASGFRYWQMCPLGPTGYGNSPYQCFSAFAGNPYLIDVLELSRIGLISSDQLGPLLFLSSDRVNYGMLYRLKLPLLDQAYASFRRNPRIDLPYGSFSQFKRKHAQWLDVFAFFSALKDHFHGQPWWEWPKEVRTLESAEQTGIRSKLQARIEAHQFFQYLFFGQWTRLRARARELNISIIGDVPLFVARDSADVWAEPDLFQLDRKTSQPTAVAGCPPDYFSEDGQLWGNPLFDWEGHRKADYQWWRRRLKANFDLYDVIRIDHFRGFEAYWSIPGDHTNARRGQWEKGPGLDFFRILKKHFPEAKLIAEDLGDLSDAVFEMRDQTGLPGMAVLQFAFGGEADNLYLPHNLQPNSVIYPGTHDNDTSRGWYAAADEKTRDHVRRYFRISGEEISWDFVRAAYRSVSRLAIVSLQDLLDLGSEARLNVPGTGEGNWEWRFRAAQLNQLEKNSSAYLQELGELYGRLPPKVAARAISPP